MSRFNATREDFFAPVEVLPLSQIAPGFTTNSQNANVVLVNTPEGEKKVVGHVSDRYGVTCNSKVIAPFEDWMKSQGLEYTARFLHNEHRQFHVDFVIENAGVAEINGVDSLKPRIRINTSYDGTVKHSVCFGSYRLICSNGMMGVGYDNVIKIKHTKGKVGKVAADRVSDMFGQFLEGFQVQTEVYAPLYDRKIDNLEEAAESIANISKFPVRMVEGAVHIAQMEAAQLGQDVTAWLLMQGFNYQLNHAEAKVEEKVRMELDVAVQRAVLTTYA